MLEHVISKEIKSTGIGNENMFKIARRVAVAVNSNTLLHNFKLETLIDIPAAATLISPFRLP